MVADRSQRTCFRNRQQCRFVDVRLIAALEQSLQPLFPRLRAGDMFLIDREAGVLRDAPSGELASQRPTGKGVTALVFPQPASAPRKDPSIAGKVATILAEAVGGTKRSPRIDNAAKAPSANALKWKKS
nr:MULTISPECIES: DUF3763 domain-containing protein [unclassified Mesorhizobium]